MASAMRVFRKFRSSDGRIKIATLSGVSALVAVMALLVGVLPVFADHTSSKIAPVPNDEGGGSGKCSVETGDLPSAAGLEFHINNPTTGPHVSADGAIAVEVTDTDRGRVFSFNVVDDRFVVYDVVVNGGPKSNHYDYDGSSIGPVSGDVDLHAPTKGNKLHNLSHINICYDEPGKAVFECGEELERRQEGLFTVVTATIFGNSVWACDEGKRGIFLVDNTDTDTDDPSVLIDLGTGEGTAAGMATFTKDFGQPPEFEDLKYQLSDSDPLVDVEWCTVRGKDTTATGTDSDEFDTWLGTNDYPSLDGVTDAHTGTDGPAIACKVYEEEDASGIQFTVVYFEFEDPRFR